MMDETLIFPLTCATTTIYGATLPDCARNERRSAERRTVASLIESVFGNRHSLTHDEHGAPLLIPADDSPYISISHGAGHALLAVDADCRIGIDIETPRPTLARTAPRFMSDGEMRVHGRSHTAILRAWTAKEAIFKALGMPDLTVADICLPDIIDDGPIILFDRRISLTFIEKESFTIAIARLI